MKLSKNEVNNRNYYSLDGKAYTGKIEIMYENSKNIKTIGYILNGFKSGEWYYFYENGNTQKIENYKYGELNGIYMSFYEDGNLKETGYIKYNKLEDMWYTYFSNGNIQTENRY